MLRPANLGVSAGSQPSKNEQSSKSACTRKKTSRLGTIFANISDFATSSFMRSVLYPHQTHPKKIVVNWDYHSRDVIFICIIIYIYIIHT